MSYLPLMMVFPCLRGIKHLEVLNIITLHCVVCCKCVLVWYTRDVTETLLRYALESSSLHPMILFQYVLLLIPLFWIINVIYNSIVDLLNVEGPGCFRSWCLLPSLQVLVPTSPMYWLLNSHHLLASSVPEFLCSCCTSISISGS